MFDCSPVFYANYKSEADIVINQGGTDSGKTYAIMQLLFLKAIEYRRTPQEPDMIITVVGESVPNLKKGAYRIAESIYLNCPEIRQRIGNWNKSDRIIQFRNGAIIEFTSYETEQQAKQGKRQYAFFNEAQGVSWLIFWQICKRTRKQTFIDYNPTVPFWAHDELIKKPTPDLNEFSKQVERIISDHRHNPFLTAKEHAETEGIKNKDLWDVYARGKTGNLKGIIFPDWQPLDPVQFATTVDNLQFIGGLDYGYTNDPTAGVKVWKAGDSIFVKELSYTPGIPVVQLKSIFAAEGFTGMSVIYCDHDKMMTNELRKVGLMALPASKGPGSIINGINFMKQFKFYYCASSGNLKVELQRYHWATDKTNGEPTNTPIDGYCHLLDAIRYACFTHWAQRGIKA